MPIIDNQNQNAGQNGHFEQVQILPGGGFAVVAMAFINLILLIALLRSQRQVAAQRQGACGCGCGSGCCGQPAAPRISARRLRTVQPRALRRADRRG